MPTLNAVKRALRRYALTFEGSKEDHPWGENVTKVKGKVFVFFGTDDPRSDGVMGVKLVQSLLYARSLPHVEPMGYGLGKSGWCSVKKPSGDIDVTLMKEWIAESCQTVAPKRLAARAIAAPPAASEGEPGRPTRACGSNARSAPSQSAEVPRASSTSSSGRPPRSDRTRQRDGLGRRSR